METQTFDGLGIKAEIMAVLNKLHFTVPTPIQSQAIPVAIQGSDVIGIAQTGTGKTLAFGVPAIQSLLASGGTALIILPTRELALQVDESLSPIFRSFNLRSAVLIGGANMNKQISDLKAGPRIIVSTPGRLIDHLERKTLSLSKVSILVLDEADRMLDMGFEPQIRRILQQVPKERQTMLFSATMPKEIVSIANQYMKSPLRVEVAPAGTATDNVTHEIFFVRDGSKLPLLENVLKSHDGSILIFTRTKFGAKKLAFAIRKLGFTSTEIHSNRSQAQRVAALEGFKQGKYKIMVATDIAARGIDVKGIELVINYDLPDCPEDYVHRIGRTGRAENLGHAISFATPAQLSDIRSIERLIKKQLPVSKVPENLTLNPALLASAPQRGESRDGSRGRGEHRSRGESRGRTASGSRYGSDRDRDRGRRGDRREDRHNAGPSQSYAEKGRDFYKEMNAGVLDSNGYMRSGNTTASWDPVMDFGDSRFEGSGRKPFGKFESPTKEKKRPFGLRGTNRSDHDNRDAGRRGHRTDEGRKPAEHGRKFEGNKRGKRAPFSRAPKQSPVHSSR